MTTTQDLDLYYKTHEDYIKKPTNPFRGETPEIEACPKGYKEAPFNKDGKCLITSCTFNIEEEIKNCTQKNGICQILFYPHTLSDGK